MKKHEYMEKVLKVVTEARTHGCPEKMLREAKEPIAFRGGKWAKPCPICIALKELDDIIDAIAAEARGKK